VGVLECSFIKHSQGILGVNEAFPSFSETASNAPP
jgi:hypothetical protein